MQGAEDGVYKLARLGYYKYRAANLMFGFNTHVTSRLTSFCEFNALRKNQLLAFYAEIAPLLQGCVRVRVRDRAAATRVRRRALTRGPIAS